MKAMSIVLKILTALAAVAGVVYVIATYGDKIVAWAKGLLGKCECDDCECCDCECGCECECECEEAEEETVEETTEEAPAAEEADFEG